MSKAIVSVDKITKLFRTITGVLQENLLESNEKEAYFYAHCKIMYQQDFDVDTESGINAELKPGAVLDATEIIDAEASTGFSVDKSKEGKLKIEQTLVFKSDDCLESLLK